MSFLSRMAVAALVFVHFRHPGTGEKMYAPDAAGKNDLDKPIGIVMATPGSTEYRAAEAAINTENLRLGFKNLTGERMHQNQTDLLAKTAREFKNFDYNGKGCSEEAARQLFDDPEYVAVREQCIAGQGDLGNASRAMSKG